MGDGNTITIGGPNPATVTTTTTANSSDGSKYPGTGPNTIELGRNNTLTIMSNAAVKAVGVDAQEEAINTMGFGNKIINYGEILSNTSSAIFLQNNRSPVIYGTSSTPNDAFAGNANLTDTAQAAIDGRTPFSGNFATLIYNYGTIEALSGVNLTQSTQAIGQSSNAQSTLFVNEEGATVQGNVVMGSANDTVALFTGSSITGKLDGGAGTDTLILDAVVDPALPVGTLNGALTNFEILTKLGSGEWIITGPISTTSAGGVTATVQQGTLTLTGANTNFTGSMTVFPDAVLQIGRGSTSGSFAAPITDNGIVAFNRSDTLTHSNVISGSGQVGQIGTGTLILLGANTYAGGTFINSGTLKVMSDSAAATNPLGAPNGPLTFNAPAPINTTPNPMSPPTFQFGASFDLNPGRVITINSPGGTFDTNGFSSTIAQGIIGDGMLTKAGDGSLILTGMNTYTGGTTISRGTLVVGDFTHPSAALSGGGPITVGSEGTLGGYGSVTGSTVNNGVIAAGSATPGFINSPTGTFTIIGNLLNPGAIQLASGESIGNVLEVHGNYVGAGGTMAINTFLGRDGSPSDILVINSGEATGNTSVHVTNVGGPGALTTANGIEVVSAVSGATTAPGAFTLSNGELRAGAFDYDLFRGGVGISNRQDWFLRSSFIGGGGGGGGGGGVLPPIPPFPIDPPPNPLPPNVLFPIIGPELATYGVVQPLARQLGLSILGTLDDRMGDTYEPDGCAIAPAVASETSAVDLPTKKPATVPTKKPGPAPCPLFSPSVWGRFFGQTIHNNYQGFTDPNASGNTGGFQGGIDLLRGPLIAGHYDRAGLYGAFGDTSVDVNGLITNSAATAYLLRRTGSLNLNAWSAGGYWTHVGPTGWYLDAVLQGTWYVGSASTQFAKLDTDGTGFIASLEGGYPFSWPQLGPRFVIEPQGQILWQKVSFAQRNDGLGDVALGDTTGPSGRIGLRTKWTIATAGGQVWQPYLRGNLWRDWGAEADAVYSGTDLVPLASQVTRLELGGGLTGRINANVSVFANVDYEFAVGASESEKRNGVRGAFGAKYTW